MSEQYLRKLSDMEAFFIDLDTCGCSMTFHFFLKLRQKPHIDILEQTLQTMLDTHPGINLRFHNQAWYLSRDLEPCQIIELNSEDVVNVHAARVDFRRRTLSMNVLHTPQDQWYLCFDFFHSAMDGRSAIQFIYEFFNLLNGLPAANCDFTADGIEMVSKNGVSKQRMTIPCWCQCRLKEEIVNKGNGAPNTVVLQAEGATKAMSAKLSHAVGKCFAGRWAKVIVPVDARRHSGSDKHLFGNLFVPVFVDANISRTIDELHSEIISRVKDSPYLAARLRSLAFYHKIPQALRLFAIRRLLWMVRRSRKFVTSALVSPLGEIKHDRLQSSYAQVDDVSVTYVAYPYAAFTLINLQYNGHTNTTVCWDTGYVPESMADKLIDHIDQVFVSDPACV